MKDEGKTREQLMDELAELRRRIDELEVSEYRQRAANKASGVKIGEILMEMGYLTQLQLERSLKKQEARLISHMLSSKHQRLGEMMVESGIITEEQLHNALTEQQKRLHCRRR